MTYHLPCECGRRLQVTAGMAGSSVPCHCGRVVPVPTLTELKHLPVEPEGPGQPPPPESYATHVQPRPSESEEVREFYREIRQATPRVWVTPAVIAVNVAVFAAMAVREGLVADPAIDVMIGWGANYAPGEARGEWWRLLTAAFLHFGPVHLLLNMVCLLAVGPLVERLLGNAGFAVMYLLAAVGGSLASMGWDPAVVSAGASGAVFGVNGALLGYLARARGTIPAAVVNRLWAGPIVFAGYNLVGGLLLSNIDNAAHVGGLVVGLLAGLAVGRPVGAEFDPDRRRRAVVALVGGAVVLGVALVQVRHRVGEVPDWPAEFDQLARLEREAGDRYEAARGQLLKGEITDLRFAEVVERESVPTLREAERRIDGWRRVPEDMRPTADRLREYFRAWRTAFELQARANREGDAKAAEQAAEWMRKAERLASDPADKKARW